MYLVPCSTFGDKAVDQMRKISVLMELSFLLKETDSKNRRQKSKCQMMIGAMEGNKVRKEEK